MSPEHDPQLQTIAREPLSSGAPLALLAQGPASSEPGTGDACDAASAPPGARRDLEAAHAAVEQGDLARALTLLEKSLCGASEAEDRSFRAEVLLSTSIVLARMGRFEDGYEHARAASEHLPPGLAGRLELQVALLHHREGKHDDALAGYDRAIPELVHAGDLDRATRARNNRALLLAERGQLDVAARELEHVESFYRGTADLVAAYKAQHNRALLLAQSGDVQGALTLLESVDRFFTSRGLDRAIILADRCRVLIDAGLVDDAWPVADEAAVALRGSGAELELAELQLAVGRLAFMGDRLDHVRHHLRAAAARFAELGLESQAAHAGYLLSLADLVIGTDAVPPLAHTEGATPDGLGQEAVHGTGRSPLRGGPPVDVAVTVHAAMVVFSKGYGNLASRIALPLTLLARRGPPVERALLALAHALVAFDEGDWRKARAALRSGYQHVQFQLLAMGTTEMRGTVLRHANRLSVVGNSMGVLLGSADECFEWTERARGLVALARPQRTSRRDPDGRPPGGRAVIDDLRERLDDHDVIMFVNAAPDLAMLSVGARGGTRLRDLGPYAEVSSAVARLHAAFARLTAGADVTGAARRHVRDAADLLDEKLGRPGEHAASDALVVVPSGALAGVAWALLPSVENRPVTVATSASSWEAGGPVRTGSALLVAGPGLVEADAEVLSIATCYRDPCLLRGSEATVQAVVGSIVQVDVAHFSAHGRLRRDNPMYSALELADGQLLVRHLDELVRLPPLVVWSACRLGQGGVGGDVQLFGLCSALSGRGTKFLVAATETVRDGEARRVMQRFHELLAAGLGPDRALSKSQGEALGRGDLTAATFCTISVP